MNAKQILANSEDHNETLETTMSDQDVLYCML